MLTTQNSGKYLTKRWEEQRERCAQDKEHFTAEEQAYLEISGQSVGMGDRRQIEQETFKADTIPFPTAPGKKAVPREIDLRDRPEVGR